MIYYVYWLHLPGHSNIFREGYIGVSQNPKKRLNEHKRNDQNPHLTNALKKYKDITHTILLQGSKNYCYKIEEKLRPFKEIGWNINKGGTDPPSMLGMKRPQQRLFMIKNNPVNIPGVLQKRANNKAKDWKITNPQGDIFYIHNLQTFCQENNLHVGNMCWVAKGKKKHSQGWKCEYAEKETR